MRVQQRLRTGGNPHVTTIVATVLLFCGGAYLLSVGAAAYLSPRDNLREADAIVVVSGGGTERIDLGIQLYNDGWADALILSGAARDSDAVSNAEMMRRIAIARGVPRSAISTDDRSLTTYQNAVNVRYILPPETTRIILVTSSYHMRRASLTFASVLGDDVEILCEPADVAFFKPWSWWQTDLGRRLFLSEATKIAYALSTGKYERDDGAPDPVY